MRHLPMACTAMAGLFLWTAGPVAAQTAPSTAKAYKLSRTADGHPDLQGMYDLATITPVERPMGAAASYNKEEARKLEVAAAKQRAQGDQAIDGNRTAPPKGGDGSVGAAGNVGGDNTRWVGPRSTPTIFDGQGRASVVIDPPPRRPPPPSPPPRGKARAAGLPPRTPARR